MLLQAFDRRAAGCAARAEQNDVGAAKFAAEGFAHRGEASP